jgi:hypothetical protein
MEQIRRDLLAREDLSEKTRVRLMGTCNKESGQFLNAIRSRNLGLRLEDKELTIAVALRIGCNVTDIQRSYNCQDIVHVQKGGGGPRSELPERG